MAQAAPAMSILGLRKVTPQLGRSVSQPMEMLLRVPVGRGGHHLTRSQLRCLSGTAKTPGQSNEAAQPTAPVTLTAYVKLVGKPRVHFVPFKHAPGERVADVAKLCAKEFRLDASTATMYQVTDEGLTAELDDKDVASEDEALRLGARKLHSMQTLHSNSVLLVAGAPREDDEVVRRQAESIARQQAESIARQQAESMLVARQQAEVIRIMAMHLESLAPRAGIASPSKLAHTTMEALDVLHDGVLQVADVVAAQSIAHPHAILTVAEQAELHHVTEAGAEVDVIRYLTPHLARLRQPPAAGAAADGCAPVLVNSEEYQWLVHPATRSNPRLTDKPDLFRTWRPFVSFRDGKPRQAQGEGAFFGPLADVRLQEAGCVREIYEGKRVFKDPDFGELCAYHMCIPGPCFGMLFDATRFWLYRSMNGHPLQLIKGEWTQLGAEEVVRAFFTSVPEPPLLQVLRLLLRDLKVSLCFIKRTLENKATERAAHLGSGAYGHVFAVGDEAAPQALKVILTSKPNRVAQEFSLLKTASEDGAPVVAPVPDSLTLYEAGGGYMLTEVGSPFVVTTRAQCRDAFATLALLHSKGVTHGDPRLPNLLRCNGGLRWIDLASSALYYGEPARADVRVLAASVLGLDHESRLPAHVQAAIAAYAARDPASAQVVADAVWSARSKTP